MFTRHELTSENSIEQENTLEIESIVKMNISRNSQLTEKKLNEA